jgi:type I restriction-modification system DNA methylase subunit
MANMNMIIHDLDGVIEIGDTFKNPKFTKNKRVQTFDRVVANPMWNQDWFSESDYENDELGRFSAGYPGSIADWGWMQIILASMNADGKAAVVLGMGSASRGSNDENSDPERAVREYFVENDFVEAVVLLPHNMFYNTDAPGLVYILNKNKAPERKGKVLFINASDGFKKGKPKNILRDDVARAILDCYMDFSESEGFSRIVTAGEIRLRGYNLRSSRYVIKPAVPNVIPLSSAIDAHITTTEGVTKLAYSLESHAREALGRASRGRSETDFGILRDDCEIRELRELFAEVDERAGDRLYPVLSCSKIHGVILQEEKFNYAVASADLKKYKIVMPNMFVYDPMLLWDGSIGMNRYKEPGIVSPAYTTFKSTSEEVELDYLEFILRSQIMIPFYISISDGTNWRRRKAKFRDFLSLKIPLPAKPLREAIKEALVLRRLSSEIAKVSEELGKSLLRQGMLG